MTSTSVAIVDYGMGNLRSVAQAVLHAAQGLPVSVAVTSQPQAVRDAARVILPGQGAMGDCMAALRASGLQEAVLQAAASKPLLGICVGMQMLLEHSAEGHTAAGTPGLALLPGEVLKFDFAGRRAPDGSACKVPQMGWNRVRPCTHSGVRHPLWEGVRNLPAPGESGAARAEEADGGEPWFYFVHSYYACCARAEDVAGQTEYGGLRFASAIARGNLFATQFHPEKSAEQGLRLFRNFLRWNP